MIKAIVVNFGGVVVRTEDPGPRHAWDARLGLPTGSVERAVQHSDLWIQAQLGRVSEKVFWNGVAEMLRMSRDLIPELVKDYYSGDRLNYRLVELLRELHEQGWRTAVLSNDVPGLAGKIEALGLAPLFDHILISSQIGVMKPDRTAYRIALNALGVQPEEAVMVDDVLAHVHGAQAVGMHAILYRHDTDVRGELERLVRQTA